MRFHRRWGLFALSLLRVQAFGCMASAVKGTTALLCCPADPNTVFCGNAEFTDGEHAECILCNDGEEYLYNWKEKQLK